MIELELSSRSLTCGVQGKGEVFRLRFEAMQSRAEQRGGGYSLALENQPRHPCMVRPPADARCLLTPAAAATAQQATKQEAYVLTQRTSFLLVCVLQ